jgi:hypothetical protein
MRPFLSLSYFVSLSSGRDGYIPAPAFPHLPALLGGGAGSQLAAWAGHVLLSGVR